MKLGIEIQLKELVKALPRRQQTLDFVGSKLWEQLPTADQQACRAAIAALLCHVTLATQENNEHE